MDDLKPLAASLQPLTTSLKQSGPLTDRRQARAEYAAERARLLFGQFRKGDANDPTTYTASIAAVLAGYPDDVVRQATDPRSGLGAHLSWLPTVKEVHDFCREIVDAEAQAARRERDLEHQIASRAEYEGVREAAPTRAELQARGFLREEPVAALPADALARIIMAKQSERGSRLKPDAASIAILRAGGYGVDEHGIVTAPKARALAEMGAGE